VAFAPGGASKAQLLIQGGHVGLLFEDNENLDFVIECDLSQPGAIRPARASEGATSRKAAARTHGLRIGVFRPADRTR
jgi:hypothetical protein